MSETLMTEADQTNEGSTQQPVEKHNRATAKQQILKNTATS